MATTVQPTSVRRTPIVLSRKHRRALRKALLACGVGYGVAYVLANDVVAAAMWDDYSRLDQAISELSGTEAPSRGFLNAVLPVFTLLVAGFGVGTWQTARHNRALRAIGGILILQGVLFPLWLLVRSAHARSWRAELKAPTTPATWC